MPHQTVTTVNVNAEGRGTQVTYVLEREQDFMGKMIGLIADVETLLGADVDRRLKRLKFEAERAWLHRSEKSSRAKLLMERASRMSQPVPEESAPKDP